MDDERKQQVDIFLGVKSKQYFPTLHLLYRDDPVLVMDYPESDDEMDGLGQLTWPLADKMRTSQVGWRTGTDV